MKGLLVVSDASDIAFYSLDRELEHYIVDRIRGLEETAGAQAEEGGSYSDIRDALGAFFLPFNTSFGVLNSLKKPVLAITSEEGFLLVFRKFGESVYISVGRSDVDTEEALSKRLFAFNSLVGLLYGPVDSCMCSSDMNERKKVWQKLSSLLKTYDRLYDTEQAFLLEAIEHVQFGQIQAAQDVVVKVVKECLDPSSNGGLPNVQHVMLLSNCKILAICGKSPQLPNADLLLMILYISNLFHETLSTFEEESPDPPEGSPEPEEAVFPRELDPSGMEDDGEADDGDGADHFQTPRSTPARPPSGEQQPDDPFETEDPQFSIPPDSIGDLEEQLETPAEGRKDATGVGKSLPSKLRFLIGGLGKRAYAGAEAASGFPMPDSQGKYIEELVFVQPTPGTFLPHAMHCLEIQPGIVLALIRQLPGGQVASFMCSALVQLRAALNPGRPAVTGGLATFSLIEDAMRRISDHVNREVQATASRALSPLNVRMQNAWCNLKTAKFKLFMERGLSPTEDPSYTRVDACGRDLVDKLVKVFEKLYFTPKQREFDTNQVVSRLMKNSANLKKDYGEFLALKGILNFPMISFCSSYPGMIYFSHIDRCFDELTAPSLGSDDHVGIPYVEELAASKGVGAGVFFRKKVWRMVERVRRFLALGYTSQTWLDEDFLYSYYMWINVPGSVPAHPMRFLSPSSVRATEFSPPGIIGTSFYSDVYKGAFGAQGYIYELYSMHVPTTPIKVAASQCKSLVHQLWPTSKEAIAPFSLIN